MFLSSPRLLRNFLPLLLAVSSHKENPQLVGCQEIHGMPTILIYFISFLYFYKVSSSGKMETFCAKTLILNLAWEHSLEIHSITTDRAKDMKTLMRLDNIITITII